MTQFKLIFKADNIMADKHEIICVESKFGIDIKDAFKRIEEMIERFPK